MVVEPLPQEGPDRKDEMLQELKKIRASLETPPSPAPPKGLWNEFKDFLSKYKILGMAIAIVIGVYLGLLVQALVAGFLIPLIGLAIPGMSNLSTYMHNHTRPKIHSWRLPIGTNNVPNSRTYPYF